MVRIRWHMIYGKKLRYRQKTVKKEKMKLVREEENKDVFEEIFENEVAEFRVHVNRIKNQYTPLRQLKAQPDARRNKDADAKLLINLKEDSEGCQVYIVRRIPQGTIMKIRSTTDLYYAIPATVLLAVMLVYIS